MQPTFSSSRILLPVRPWFIYFSLALALMLNFLPTAHWPGMPDWVALVLCFWSIREYRRAGMGSAFLLGLLMDVADGAILGQHCFAYVLLSYAASSFSRRILWFPISQQALHIMPLLVGCQIVQATMRLITGAHFPGFGYFLSPFVATLLWLPMTFILLLPQYRPVEEDPNRPI